MIAYTFMTNRRSATPSILPRLSDMPFERIIDIEWLVMAQNQHLDILKDGLVVRLACGHKLLTKARNRVCCPRCHEMLRRSIATGLEDYDSFRKGLIPDRMEWPGDTMRIFHEPSYAAECARAGKITRFNSASI